MSQANTSLVRQIGTSFELVVSQIDAQIYRFVSYDNGLMQSVQKRKQSISEMIKLYQTLDAAAIGNRYLYSIYLYVPDEKRIFASDRGASYTRDKFFDPTVWPYLESGQTGIVPPRTVVAAASAVQSKMLISTVFPLIGTGGQPSGILVANIDLELLYQDILKSIQVSDNQKVYIYNEEGTIIASPDQKNMFSPIQDVYRKDTDSGLSYWIDAILHRRTVMQSHASSSRLGINFYLWTDIPIQYENIPNLSIWIPGFLILAVTGAVLCYLVIRTSTRPLQEAVFALNEKILRDLLLDTSHGKNSALAQLERLDQKFEYERFLVVLCETPKTDIELWDYGKSVLEEIYPDGKNPTTLDELAEVWRQMTFNDPDGNGQKDTYGITTTGGVKVEAVQFAFGLFWKDGIADRDGSYKIHQKMSGYIPYLTWMRERYAEGVIDPEFVTNKTTTASEKFMAGATGMLSSHQAGVISKVKTQPNAIEIYDYIAGPVDIETGELNIYNSLPIWGGYMISADSKYIDKCLELLDYCNGPEGFQLMAIGIEGVHYNSYDPATQLIDRTSDQAALYNTVGSTYFTFAYAHGGQTCIIEGGDTKERVDAFHAMFDPVKERCNYAHVPSIRTPKYSSWGADHPDLQKEFQEMEIKYVVGEISLEEFEAFLNSKYFPAWEEAEAEYIEYMESLKK